MGNVDKEMTRNIQSAAQAALRSRVFAPNAQGLSPDPITRRMICEGCWNRIHGTRKSPVCKLRDCQCGCKDAAEVRAKERAARTAAREERKTLERQQLEAEDNPLRACNPEFEHDDDENDNERREA